MKPGALFRTNASGKFVEIRARTGEEASDLRETELGSVADVDPEQDLVANCNCAKCLVDMRHACMSYH